MFIGVNDFDFYFNSEYINTYSVACVSFQLLFQN